MASETQRHILSPAAPPCSPAARRCSLGARRRGCISCRSSRTTATRSSADENRINLRLLAPPRGRIFDRFGVPLADNRQNYRVVIVPEQAGDIEATLDALGELIDDHRRRSPPRAARAQRKHTFRAARRARQSDLGRGGAHRGQRPELPGVAIEAGHDPPLSATARRLPCARLCRRRVGEGADRRPAARAARLPHRQERRREVARHEAARHAPAPARSRSTPIGRVVRELARTTGEPGQDVVLGARHGAAGFRLCGAAPPSPASPACCSTRRPATCWRWCRARASTRRFLDRPHPGDVAGAVDRSAQPADQQGDRRRLPARLDLQADGRAGRARSRRRSRPTPRSAAPAISSSATPPSIAGRRAATARSTCATRSRIPATSFLRDGAAHRHRSHRRDGAALRLRRPLGFDIPGERGGLIPTRDWKLATTGDAWQPGETLIAGIGQGSVLATPLQLATMAARLVTGRAVCRTCCASCGCRRAATAAVGFPALGIKPRHLALVLDGMSAVVNEQGGTAYAARISDAGPGDGRQVRHLAGAAHHPGRARARACARATTSRGRSATTRCSSPSPRSAAPRYVCAVVVEHGGETGGGGSAVAAPICRDVLVEAQRRDPARRVPQPDALLRVAPEAAAAQPANGPVAARAAEADGEPFLRYRPARADPSRQAARHPMGAGAAARGDRLHRLRDALFGGRRQTAALGVAPDDAVRDRPGADDRDRADRYPLLVRCAYWIYGARAPAAGRGRSARIAAWGRSAGSTSASSSCSRRS